MLYINKNTNKVKGLVEVRIEINAIAFINSIYLCFIIYNKE